MRAPPQRELRFLIFEGSVLTVAGYFRGILGIVHAGARRGVA